MYSGGSGGWFVFKRIGGVLSKAGYRWSDLPKLLGVAVMYALLAKIALTFFVPSGGGASLVWPSSGFALSALLIGGIKFWPGVYIGALFGQIVSGTPIGGAMGIACGNTLAALVGCWLLTGKSRFNAALEKPRDYLRLGLAGAVSVCVSALIGVWSLSMAGVVKPSEVTSSLLYWWQGDLLGILLVTSLALVWRQPPRDWLTRARGLEAAACLGLVILSGQIIFLGQWGRLAGLSAHTYWTFVFVVWAALRLGRHGVVLVINLTAAQALLGAISGQGPFGTELVHTGLIHFWFHTAAVAVVGIPLALVIHARKQSVKALQQSEAQYKALVNSVEGIVWEVDPVTFRFTFVSPQAERLLGYPLAQWYEKDFWVAHVHPEDREWAVDFCKTKTEAGEAHRFEYRMIAADGGVVWIHDAVALVIDGGRLNKLCGVMVDISERKQMENRLLLTQFTMEHAVDAIYWIDKNARIVDVNQAACEMLGYRKEELCSLAVPDINPGFSIQGWPAFWEKTKECGAVIIESSHQARDGRIIPIEVNVNYLVYEGKEYHCAFVRNISERKRVEADLRLSRERFELAARGVVDGIWDWNVSTGDVYLSSRLCEMLGYGVEELAPRLETWLLMLHPEDKEATWAKVQAHLERREPYDAEYRLRTKSGEYRWCRARGQARWDEEGGPIRMAGSLTDITERKKVEHRQAMMMRELDHRVKNNLAAVVGLCRETAAASQGLADFQGRFTERIEAMARVHTALARHNWEGVRLDKLVGLTLAPYTRGFNKERIELSGPEVTIPAGVVLPLSMSLHELGTNAVKYGSLSNSLGRVCVSWFVDEQEKLALQWREFDGPAVSRPAQTGMGTELIHGFIEYELGGEAGFDFSPMGLVVTIGLKLQKKKPKGSVLGLAV